MSEVKILLCDDDADLLGLLIRRLKKMGIEPDTASDGREAKSLVDANNYDVIVTDIYMPEATGLEVMQHAKQKDADTQVVIITSSATLDNAIDALNHGSFGYLTKPFDHLIVFDNMVSRALEYRQLVVADKRKAEAQRRRGDMLEDEVAQRVQQLQKTQKGLLDLLGSLPDGILVVEEGGKVVLSSPVGERWLSLDQKSDDQPIHAFVGQVHAETPDPFADVTVDGTDLHLMTANFPAEGEAKRKAVIIREMEDIAGAGSMVTETVMGIKKGLATLYEQGMGTEVVLNVASQFAVLEQLQGWSTGTGELEPSKVEAEAPAPSTPAEAPAPPALTEAPETPTPAETPATPAPGEAPTTPAPGEAPATPAPAQTPPAPPVPAAAPSQEQSPAPENPAQAPTDPEGMTTVPPFTLPRERTPTGELEGPRLNTSELQDALRATAPPEAQQAAAEPSIESPVPPESTAEPQAPIADPMAETLVSSAQELSQGSAIAAAPEETSIIEQTGAPIPAETPLEESGSKEAEGVAPAADVVAPFDPDAQPMGAVDPTVMDEAPAPPGEDSETSDDTEPNSFPRAVAGSADVPSWIDGIEGITDPDLLQDFEFEAEQPEATFPQAQTGELLDDDSMFKPRVIPEQINAKLKTPLELPNANGDQEQAPPQHEGPITIQASQADTQMFRKVLEGLSGTQVLSGDYEKQAEEAPSGNGDAAADSESGLDELRAEIAEPPTTEVPMEAPKSEPPAPTPEELREAQELEPEPQPVPADPANWPPTLPTEDDDWDDELDVSG